MQQTVREQQQAIVAPCWVYSAQTCKQMFAFFLSKHLRLRAHPQGSMRWAFQHNSHKSRQHGKPRQGGPLAGFPAMECRSMHNDSRLDVEEGSSLAFSTVCSFLWIGIMSSPPPLWHICHMICHLQHDTIQSTNRMAISYVLCELGLGGTDKGRVQGSL